MNNNSEKRQKTISIVIQALIALLTALSGVFAGCQMAWSKSCRQRVGSLLQPPGPYLWTLARAVIIFFAWIPPMKSHIFRKGEATEFCVF